MFAIIILTTVLIIFSMIMLAEDELAKIKKGNFLIVLINSLIIYFTYRYLTFYKYSLVLYIIAFIVIPYNLYVLFIKFRKKESSIYKIIRNTLVVVDVLLIFYLVLTFIGSRHIFNISRYEKIVNVEDRDFSEDFDVLTPDDIPYIDKDMSYRLVSNSLSNIEDKDLISSLAVSPEFHQINVNGRPKRISLIYYNSFIKWNIYKDKGQYGYVLVDMIDGKVDIIKASDDKPIMYTEYDYGSKRNINTHLVKKYRTKNIGKVELEVDDKGNLHYIMPIYEDKSSRVKELSKVVVASPYDGSIKEYNVKEDDIPVWIDRIYDESWVLDNLKWHYKFKNGWLNNIIGSKTTYKLSSGYNYLTKDNNVWLYTGLRANQKYQNKSNVGYLMVNLRTGEVQYYDISGVDENGAMDYVLSSMPEKEYDITFPLLLNINNRPTYYMTLKDTEDLVKGHAFTDISDISKTNINISLVKAYDEYVKDYASTSNLNNEVMENNENINNKDKIKDIENNNVAVDTDNKKEKIVTIKGQVDTGSIKDIVIDGNSYRVLKIDSKTYIIPVKLDINILYVSEGDVIEIDYIEKDTIKTTPKVTKVTIH